MQIIQALLLQQTWPVQKHNWISHGMFIKGSQTWMAFMGPGILPFGEVKEPNQFYQQQLAQTIVHLLGEEFMIDSYSFRLPPLF